MLKKKIKLLAIIIVTFLLLTSFAPVFAEEVTNAEGTTPAEEVTTTEDTTNVEDSNTLITNDVKTVQGDKYITDDDVTIDYIIDGNLYVIADKLQSNLKYKEMLLSLLKK